MTIALSRPTIPYYKALGAHRTVYKSGLLKGVNLSIGRSHSLNYTSVFQFYNCTKLCLDHVDRSMCVCVCVCVVRQNAAGATAAVTRWRRARVRPVASAYVSFISRPAFNLLWVTQWHYTVISLASHPSSINRVMRGVALPLRFVISSLFPQHSDTLGQLSLASLWVAKSSTSLNWLG